MKIGIFGGTFDPIHEGHLQIAEQVLNAFQLDRIDFIPCFKPPHRDQPVATAQQRLKMVQLAIQGYSKFYANDCEILRADISYSIDTVKFFQNTFPNNHYYLILGEDAFAQFETWHGFEKILSCCDIIIVSRESNNQKTAGKIAFFKKNNMIVKNIEQLNITPIPISATHIRAAIQSGDTSVSGLSALVRAYILKNKLYS